MFSGASAERADGLLTVLVKSVPPFSSADYTPGLDRLRGGVYGIAQLLDALLAGDDGLVPQFLAGMGVRDEERAPV